MIYSFLADLLVVFHLVFILYVMAHQMGGDAELMASILAIQTLFSVFLLSGILVYFTPL